VFHPSGAHPARVAAHWYCCPPSCCRRVDALQLVLLSQVDDRLPQRFVLHVTLAWILSHLFMHPFCMTAHPRTDGINAAATSNLLGQPFFHSPTFSGTMRKPWVGHAS